MKPRSRRRGKPRERSPRPPRAVLGSGSGARLAAGGPLLLVGFGAVPLDGLGPPNLGWYAVLALSLLLVLSGLATAGKAAVESLRPMHAKALRDEGREPQGARVQGLFDGRARFVAASALAIQTCALLTFLVALTFSPGLAEQFKDRYGWMPALVGATLAVLIPILLLTMIVERVAISYAALHPIRVALGLERALRLCAFFFAGPTAFVLWAGNLLAARFGGNATFTIANQAEEEIKTIVETAQEAGEIESDERALLHSVFEFSDTVVREIMTPRVDIDALPVEASAAEVLDLIKTSGHSRIPLYEGTDDAIVGIIHAKDLLLAEGAEVKLRRLMRPAVVVPENKNLHDLLQEMRATRGQMVVVQDEFGGTSGIATIEDIVEELVGEIVDEYDTEEPEIVESPGGHIVDGKTHLDDVNDALGTSLASDEFDTIGGYVFGLFGRQPAEQESIEDSGYRFTVAASDGRRISKLRLEPASRPEPDA